jgi:uncharacterized HAD superfamily protein
MKRENTRSIRRLRNLVAVTGSSVLLLAGCSTVRNFKFADTDKSGNISSSEFERYMLEVIYAEADTNKDAKITFEEWQKANPDTDKRKFSAPDTNGDQVVTPTEAKAYFKKQGTLSDLFTKIDTNKDGRLSEEEIQAFTEKMEAQSGSTPIQKLSQAAN